MVTQTADNARNLPVAVCRALKVRTREGLAWELIVDKCPLCGLKHAHGGGVGPQPSYGERSAHCADRNQRGDYELVPVGGAA